MRHRITKLLTLAALVGGFTLAATVASTATAAATTQSTPSGQHAGTVWAGHPVAAQEDDCDDDWGVIDLDLDLDL